MTDDELLGRLRSIIEVFPETSERISHGSPTWWGGKKTFACFHGGSYDQGRRAVWMKAAEGAQEALIATDPDIFYRPKYLGPSGWVALRLEGDIKWPEVATLLEEAYRLVAPKRALKQLDASSGSP